MINRLVAVLFCIGLLIPSDYVHAVKEMDHSAHKEMDHSAHKEMDHSAHKEMDHSAHKAMMKEKNSYTQSEHVYEVPDLTLLNQNGETVKLKEFLSASEPYALNFIFTTCTTICPILTASFSHMQRELGAEADAVQFIAFTIDPEFDTPKVLKAYAEKVGATKNWTFLTGDYETIVAAERAFDAYVSDKMDHRPIYLIKPASSKKWVRVDGLTSGSDLAKIYLQHSQK